MTSRVSNPFDLSPGEKLTGWLPVTTSPAGSPIGIPWMAVRGAEDGPVLTVDSGIHGDEFEGPEAILRVWQALDPSTLRGTFIGVPIVNIPAYEVPSRLSPIDSVNMNRIFPGTSGRSVSHLIARRFFEDIVQKSDAVLDLHGGGSYISLLPTIICPGGDSEPEVKAQAIAAATGFDFVWETKMGASGGLAGTATHAGVPTLTVEAGSAARLTEADVQIHVQGIKNVLYMQGMQDGTQVVNSNQRRVKGSFVPSPAAGFFKSRVELGEEVSEGQVIAEICDLFGGVKEQVLAPNPGVVCIIRSLPTVLHGEEAVLVGEPIEES